MTTTYDDLDRIERTINIDAPAERVWGLLVRPGWWSNEGEVDAEPTVRREGVVDVVVHEKFGEFRLLTLRSEPPRHIAYRWIDPGSEAGTLVEFFVEDRAGGVTLRVVESGFQGLGKSRDEVVRHVQGNTEGWEQELEVARRFVTVDA